MYRPKWNSREEQNTSLGCETSVSKGQVVAKQAGQTVTCSPVGGLAMYFFGLASSWLHLVYYTRKPHHGQTTFIRSSHLHEISQAFFISFGLDFLPEEKDIVSPSSRGSF